MFVNKLNKTVFKKQYDYSALLDEAFPEIFIEFVDS